MNDRRDVRVVEPGTELFQDRQLLRDPGDRAPPDQLGERLPRHVLHRDERTVVVLADVEDRHDVGMVETAGGPGLSREALACRGVVEARFEELDHHQPVDRRITGQIDRTHAAVGEEPLDLIPADGIGRFRHVW